MSETDIESLRKNDLCVVVSDDPAAIKFLDPIPASSSRTKIEDAAIKLSRMLLNKTWGNYSQSGMLSHSDFATIYCSILMEGTPLDRNPTKEENEQALFAQEKREEIKRIAREEARAERAAKKKP